MPSKTRFATTLTTLALVAGCADAVEDQPRRDEAEAAALVVEGDVAERDEQTRMCAFGHRWDDVLASGAMTVTGQRGLVAGDALTGLEEEQIVEAFSATVDEIASASTAFGRVDAGAIDQVTLWDVEADRGFVTHLFAVEGEAFGAIMEQGSSVVSALIIDGHVEECSVF